MRRKVVASVLIGTVLAATLFTGCGGSGKSKSSSDEGGVKEFTAFFAVPGSEINDDNEIQELIAEKTGAKVKETWLTGQTDVEAIGTMIAGGEYPDFIEGGNGTPQLYDAEALVPLDDYLDDYPNIKNLFTDLEWEKLRQEDGHIYWIPQFSCIKGEEKVCTHNDEAFWIQARVLKWANYPEIKTMDDYFNLIESYNEANPTMEDGTENIPYTILCDDWRYFCLENVPQFLDGYPNDGSCIVDPDTLQVIDYNTTPTAKRYYQKLNEEYKKGMISPETFLDTYEEYLDKLSTGAVLGMVDQRWQFYYAIQTAYDSGNLRSYGCDYVPLPITIDKKVKNQWHTARSAELDTASGLSITISCEDPEGAMQFVNNLLDPEITKLRFWGEENLDYSIDENGIFYLNEEQGVRVNDQKLKKTHFCTYSYFPRSEGMLSDGINAFSPENQPAEFWKSQPWDIQECFEAYGVTNYVDMLGRNDAPGVWYPMYSYTNSLTSNTQAGQTLERMDEVKHRWLPQVILAQNFEETWNSYMEAYNACDPQSYFEDLQKELNQRMNKKNSNFCILNDKN